MIEPPIDKLIKKAPCRYALVVAVAKRTKDLLTNERESQILKDNGTKAVSVAANEVYDGNIKVIAKMD